MFSTVDYQTSCVFDATFPAHDMNVHTEARRGREILMDDSLLCISAGARTQYL